MFKVYRKVHKFSSVLSYFVTKEITFCNKKVRELWDSTSDADKKVFFDPLSSSCFLWIQKYLKKRLTSVDTVVSI